MTPLLWTAAAFTLGACIFFAGYYFGRFMSEGQARALESQNVHLRDQVSFVQADCDHLRKLLETRVAEAHVNAGEQAAGLYATRPIPCVVGSTFVHDLRDAPPYAANIGLCFHGVSLSDHCERCLNRELTAGPAH
jgi:hypothetical protein